MTMKKKLLTTLSVVLILGLAALGILAYLTDTDSDVNVMTLGNVSIDQHEYQRVVENGTYKTDTIDGVTSYVLEDFEQGKALLPATESTNYGAGPYDSTVVRMTQVDSYGYMDVFTSKNAQDKFVTVENTGKFDAYVRTLVAIEVGSADPNLVMSSSRAGDQAGTKDPWSSNGVGIVDIDGNNYIVYEYIYAGAQLSNGSFRHENGVLPAGDTTYPSFAQVYLKSETTNEDCEAIDGNGNGTLDILVLSQAVQADGFANAQTALEAAFPKGDDNENVVGWFGGMAIPNVFTADELKAALSENGEIILGDDIDMGSTKITVPLGVTATLDLNGHSITSTASQTIVNKGNLTVKGDGSVSGKIAIFNQTGTLTVLGGTYQGTQCGVGAMLGTCTVNGDFSGSSFYGCTMTGGNYEKCRIESFTILGGTYTDCEFVSTGTYQAGTFDFQPDANWTNGGKIADNGDGTWTVTQQ